MNSAPRCSTIRPRTEYNAWGERVEADYNSGASEYEFLYNLDGDEMGLCAGGMDNGGRCWDASWIKFAGRSLGYYDLYGSWFDHVNNLGTTSIVTAHDGSVNADAVAYPWGQDWQYVGSNDFHYAGFQNFESWSIYPTPTRRYNPGLYRWLSPDPLGGDITNPQSLNRYAYVLNNPTSMIDPLGLYYRAAPPEPDSPLDWGWMWLFDPPGWSGWASASGPGDGGGGGGGGGCGKSPTYDKEKCEQALKVAGQTMEAVQNALDNWGMIQQAAAANGVDPTILAAIGIRESGFNNIPQSGSGTGMGIFQIQYSTWHNDYPGIEAIAYNPSRAANFAAGIVGPANRSALLNGASPAMALATALRTWNRGPNGLTPDLAATRYAGYMDVGTAHNNYVSNVAAIAAYCF